MLQSVHYRIQEISMIAKWQEKNRTGLAVLLLVGAAACSSATDSAPTVLEGLSQSSVRDSAGGTAPTPTTQGPGFVRGTVLGPSQAGAGNDSLSTAPRVVGASVKAFPVISGANTASPTVGPEAASATTGADGKFTMPSMPGGDYVFTISPPANSPYSGVWASTRIHPGSSEWPWWVVLPFKPD